MGFTRDSNDVAFWRVARRMVEDGTAHEVVVPSHVMPASRYLELLVMELADQYSTRGVVWFRAHYKDRLA